MSAKHALITGGNSGIGRAAASQLLDRGWDVLIAARRPDAARKVVGDLSRRGSIDFVELDLANLASVRECASAVKERWPQLDALINNAGSVRSRREQSADGFELSFQTNHLGHFLLTHLLRDQLGAAESPRVVNVSSKMHQRSHGIDFDDLQMEQGYSAVRGYADGKLANVHFARELARRWPDVEAYAVHPGGVRTELGGGGELRGLPRWVWWFASRLMRSPGNGAKPVVQLAAGEIEGPNGAYFDRFDIPTPTPAAADDEAAKRLWEISAELVGV